MRRIRCLHEHRPVDPVEQAAVLALKAELLARIADLRAEEWGPCEYTAQAREIADEAQAIAEYADRYDPQPSGSPCCDDRWNLPRRQAVSFQASLMPSDDINALRVRGPLASISISEASGH